MLIPSYGNLYVKVFVLFYRETLEYYFEEFTDNRSVKTSRTQYRIEKKDSTYGKYHRLNQMTALPAGSRARSQMIGEFAQEEKLADEIFLSYK